VFAGVSIGFVTGTQAQTVEQLAVEWNDQGGSLNCREQTFQIPFDAIFDNPNVPEPTPEWFSDGPGGFSLPGYQLNLGSDGTYQVDAALSIDNNTQESGIWSIDSNGGLSFACPQTGCEFVPPFSSETVMTDSPDSVPEFTATAEHLGGSYIAFYYGDTRRLVCSTVEKTYKLRIPVTNNMPDTPEPASNCDYSDSEVNGGWGWDATAAQSCPPLDACDYSSAEINDGWGWNPVTATSCPPL
ncbi:MAG: hypothetical protein AAF404_09295, partial [Pseudomonadota bacterium]